MAYLKLLGIILVVVAIQTFHLQLDIYVTTLTLNIHLTAWLLSNVFVLYVAVMLLLDVA